MHHFNVLLLALVAHAAPWHHTIEEREEDITKSNTPILLSSVAPFEPWAGFFKGPKPPYVGSKLGLAACGALQPYQGKGWLFKEAVCKRQDDAHSTFDFVCAAEADHQHLTQAQPSPCGIRNVCMEFYGGSQLNDDAWDVACLSNQTFRQYTATGFDSSDGSKNIACSPLYTNDLQGGKTANVSLQVNVLDQVGLNRIAPGNIYFNLIPDPQQQGGTAKEIGVQRVNDAVVGSGPVAVPHGCSLQACVEPVFPQTISIYVNLNGLDIVDSATG